MKKYIYFITIILAIAIISIFLIGRDNINQEANNLVITDTIQQIIPEPVLVWGMNKDSITIDSCKVKRNQSLSNILRKKNISARTIHNLALSSKDIFDVRKIKSGNTYYLIQKDTLPEPDFMVYEESAVDYIIFDLNHPENITRGEKTIDNIEKKVAGIITTSLWNSMVESGVSPVLAVKLSDIFAWTIDFFGIQSGDQFKVIFEEQFVEGEYIGIGAIKAAYFEHMGTPIYAFHFDKNNQEGFFDIEGNSLQKAFLKAPLNYSRISGRFTNNRLHPILKYRRPHHGVDYAAPTGTPVHSIGDGVVVKKAYQKNGGGYYLTIKHNSVYKSQYMHLSKYAPGIKEGVRVKQGQYIANVGMTGLASGPHLDFRIYKNGTAVDPLKVDAPPVEPITEINKSEFITVRDSMQILLDSIPFANNNDLALN